MKIGDIIRFGGSTSATELTCQSRPEIKILAMFSCYGVVEQLRPDTDTIVHIRSLTSIPGLSFHFSWHVSDVRIISSSLSLSEAMRRQSLIDEDIFHSEEYGQLIDPVDYKKLIEELLTPLTALFPDLDYFALFEKTKMRVSHSILYTGNLLGGKFRIFDFHALSESCKLFSTQKANNDIMLLVPDDWCIHMGYSEGIIKRWVLFINELRLPLSVTYAELGGINEHQPHKMGKGEQYFLQNNSYHKILIEADEYCQINYIAYLLVRYLYLGGYNNIPGLCLQIKDKTNLSNWEILMLVHCLNSYNNYYGLFGTHKYEDKIRIPDILNKSNSETAYLKTLIKRGDVNNSFTTVRINQPYYEQLIQIIKQKQYDKISIWLSNLKDNTVAEPEKREELLPYGKIKIKPLTHAQVIWNSIPSFDLGSWTSHVVNPSQAVDIAAPLPPTVPSIAEEFDEDE